MIEAQRIVRAIGCTAQAALARSDGVVEVLPGFRDAPFLRAGGEIVWVGNRLGAMHPRAVVVDGPPRLAAGQRLHARTVPAWCPPPLPSGSSVATLRAGCDALHRSLPRVGTPKGLAAMLAGRLPAFPLDQAAAQVCALARSCAADDPASVYRTALPLLGVGTGLTPSGDDLVGAVLFARRLLICSDAQAKAWSAVAARLIDAAQTRCHAIGAALFRDLALGASFAPLHRLADCVAAKHEQAIDAARALAAIGHSSGWEMLAGFIIGITGQLTAQPQRQEMR